MDHIGKHTTHATASNTPSTVSTLKDRMKLAKYHARLIFGCFRAGDANDPEVFTGALITLLMSYPAAIGAKLSDPKGGLAGKFKFLPTISEVREEADALMAADHAKLKRARDWHEQMRLQRENEQRENEEPWEVRQRAVARVMADYKARVVSPARLKARAAFEPYTEEQLRALYGREAPKPIDQP